VALKIERVPITSVSADPGASSPLLARQFVGEIPMPRNPPPEHTRWKPGQSGNPNGGAKSRRVTRALIKQLEREGVTAALAKVWLKLAVQGDHRFFAMLLERTEGKVADVVQINDASELSDEQLVARAKELLGRVGTSSGNIVEEPD